MPALARRPLSPLSRERIQRLRKTPFGDAVMFERRDSRRNVLAANRGIKSAQQNVSDSITRMERQRQILQSRMSRGTLAEQKAAAEAFLGAEREMSNAQATERNRQYEATVSKRYLRMSTAIERRRGMRRSSMVPK